jgi:protein-tyrosine phosphatase
MVAAAAASGFDLSGHLGAQVTREMIDWADTVLAMDGSVLEELRVLAGEHATAKLRLYLPDADVPDPFARPYAAFADCVALVRDAAFAHLSHAAP